MMKPLSDKPARRRAAVLAVAGALLLALPAGIDPVAIERGAIDPAAARVVLPPSGGRSVHDLAGVISPDVVPIMERRHQELFEKTGVAIVIVTVPALEGEPIEDFAVRAGTEWGAGRKGEDRGIVVALAIAERRVFIATGYGVEGFLPDGRIGEILDDEVIPSLKRNDFSAAMSNASLALLGAAAAEYGVSVEGVSGRPGPRTGRREVELGPGTVALLVLLALIALVVITRNPWLLWLLFQGSGRRGGGMRWGSGGGFGGNSGFGGFGGGGFGGGGAGRGF